MKRLQIRRGHQQYIYIQRGKKQGAHYAIANIENLHTEPAALLHAMPEMLAQSATSSLGLLNRKPAVSGLEEQH